MEARHADLSQYAPLLAAGLTDDILVSAVRAAVRAKLSATQLDPPTAAGFDQWRHGVRRLREKLIPLGWRACDDQNFCTVVTPCGAHQIAVMQANAATGDVQFEPETIRGRGDATLFAVRANNGELFPGVATPASNCKTWCLLVHTDLRGNEIRAEISLPEQMTSAGFLVRWAHRHILPPQQLDPTPEVRKFDDGDPIDVDVALK